MSQSSVCATLKKLRELLSKKDKLKWLAIVMFALTSAALEVCAAALIVVFAGAMTAPESAIKYLNILGITGDLSPGRIVFYIALSFGALYLFKNIVATVEVFFQNFSIQKMNYIFKNKMLYKYASIDYGFFLTRNSSFGYNVVSSDIEQMFSGAMLALAMIISEFAVFVSLCAMIVYMEPSLALTLFILCAAFSFCIYKFLLPAFYRWGQKLQDTGMKSTEKLMQFFHGFKEIILFGKRDSFIHAYKVQAKEKATVHAIQTATNNTPRIVIEVLFVGLFVFAIAYMGLKHNNPQEMIGIMGGYLYLGFRVMPGLNRIINQVNNFKMMTPYIERVHHEYFHTTAGTPLKEEKDFHFNQKISFHDVSFQYLNTDKNALSNVSFDLQKGESIGIVGETGSGKSTLVDLILGLLKPTSGHILVDDSFSVSSFQWHQKIGYVPQSIYLIDDTIEANIAFGAATVDAEKLQKAIHTAQLSKLIEGLPKGAKTVVGERGVRLSGGERQRIAIARALYASPEVLIFDEATSALDTNTESNLMETINEISKDYTVIMIAHRLSTLKDCNRIVKMVGGRIEEVTDYKKQTISSKL
ncbi:MAG TPA: ABC transporter ATP-binding protein [Holosporales bacterium]|nr:ABC transporter ATP-binding protein [Holosporales bacterium]